jgi:flagellar FliL protein
VLSDDESKLLVQIDRLQHRFREQVNITVRGAEVTDLTDPGLGLIKRKILEKTNRSFGEPLLRDVLFSDFSFVEQ